MYHDGYKLFLETVFYCHIYSYLMRYCLAVTVFDTITTLLSVQRQNFDK